MQPYVTSRLAMRSLREMFCCVEQVAGSDKFRSWTISETKLVNNETTKVWIEQDSSETSQNFGSGTSVLYSTS